MHGMHSTIELRPHPAARRRLVSTCGTVTRHLLPYLVTCGSHDPCIHREGTGEWGQRPGSGHMMAILVVHWASLLVFLPEKKQREAIYGGRQVGTLAHSKDEVVPF